MNHCLRQHQYRIQPTRWQVPWADYIPVWPETQSPTPSTSFMRTQMVNPSTLTIQEVKDLIMMPMIRTMKRSAPWTSRRLFVSGVFCSVVQCGKAMEQLCCVLDRALLEFFMIFLFRARSSQLLRIYGHSVHLYIGYMCHRSWVAEMRFWIFRSTFEYLRCPPLKQTEDRDGFLLDLHRRKFVVLSLSLMTSRICAFLTTTVKVVSVVMQSFVWNITHKSKWHFTY